EPYEAGNLEVYGRPEITCPEIEIALALKTGNQGDVRDRPPCDLLFGYLAQAQIGVQYEKTYPVVTVTERSSDIASLVHFGVNVEFSPAMEAEMFKLKG